MFGILINSFLAYTSDNFDIMDLFQIIFVDNLK